MSSVLKFGRKIWTQIFPWLRVLVLLLAIAVVVRITEPERRYEVSGSARLVDGDSLFVDGVEVRLRHIDAPEGRQLCRREGRDWRCGQEATRRLKDFINRRPVSCAGREYDRHDRLLALCSIKQQELNRWMVKEGWAVSFGGYGREERQAKKARKGIWSSTFQRPSVWRAEQH